MYLMHWPVAMADNGNHELFPTLPNGRRDIDFSRHHVATYREMEEVLVALPTKVKGIGVANYSKRYLEELLPRVDVKPAINQIENHPFLPQEEVVNYCRENGIHVTAYSPLGSAGSPLLADSRVVDVAKRRAVGPGTILLSYHVSQGRSVLAKSVSPSRIEANMQLLDLSQEELDALANCGGKQHRFVYPDFGVDFGFPDKPLE